MEIRDLYERFLQCRKVTTDSRDCPRGAMFFALKGASFDGNAYARAALANGCAYAVVDEPQHCAEGDGRFILVEDGLRALQALARHHRRQLGTTVVGITGTNGKTTTKELAAAVLSKKHSVLYTQGNFNNAIGVPKTLLRLTAAHEVAVVEMGASHPGDIRELAEVAEPDYGLVTNVGMAHLQGFGSFEGVVRTKGELYDFLRAHGGKAFVNPLDPCLRRMAQGVAQVPYVDGELDCRGPFLGFRWNGRRVQTQLIGAYNIDNALAAVTIGSHFGVADDDVCKALEEYVPDNNRSQFVATKGNRLVVDAYNANPTSMAAALDNFGHLAAAHKMCILGDMGELGGAAAEEHQRIADRLAVSDFEQVWLVGEQFAKVDAPASFRRFADTDAVREFLAADRPQGMTVLIKGSHSTRLYELPRYL